MNEFQKIILQSSNSLFLFIAAITFELPPLPLQPIGGSSPRHKSEPPEEMPESKDERSPSDDGPGSPRGHRWRSRSRSKSKSKSPPARLRSRSPSKSRRSRSRSPEASNPGNNLYITGLSTRVTSADLTKYFGKEGKVTECNLVTDPRSMESRGFAFVTMESTEDADRCVKYLNRTVLEGRLITVEKAKRNRGRTPTPGRYQGLKQKHGERGRRHSRSHSPRRHYDRDPPEETGELQDLDPHTEGGQIILNPTEDVGIDPH